MQKLKINPKFKAALRDLSPDEYTSLEESIIEHGVIDPVIIWKDQVVDGHHRHEICQKHKIETPVRLRSFKDEDAVLVWIRKNQRARRNLNEHEMKLDIAAEYNAAKGCHGGDRKSSVQNEHLIEQESDKTNSARDSVAISHGVSPAKVHRSVKYAEAFDKLPKAVKTLIEEKPSRATEAAVLKMSTMTTDELNPIARDVRVGNVAKFDDVIKPKKSATTDHKKVTSPPKSQASIVKDEFDRVVIDELREQHGLNAVLKTLGNSLDKARREVKELATVKGGEWIEAQYIDGLLRDAKRAIQQAAFLCECPKCKGNCKADCKRCEGTGFIPIRSKGVLSDVEKGWLGI